MADTGTSLSTHIANLFCLAPVIKGLTKEQVAALVTFKGELTASLATLYEVVPQTEADALLKDFVATLP